MHGAGLRDLLGDGKFPVDVRLREDSVLAEKHFRLPLVEGHSRPGRSGAPIFSARAITISMSRFHP
jgi:hypothetical protein